MSESGENLNEMTDLYEGNPMGKNLVDIWADPTLLEMIQFQLNGIVTYTLDPDFAIELHKALGIALAKREQILNERRNKINNKNLNNNPDSKN